MEYEKKMLEEISSEKGIGYEKKYKEALERASKLRVQNPFDTVGQMVEHIFPELKVSEDERIRKELINFLKSPFVHENITDEKVAPWITWLEKQSEQDSPVDINKMVDEFAHAESKGYGVPSMIEVDAYRKGIEDALEKQGEHKPYGQRKKCSNCQFNYAGECKGFCQMKRDEQKPADNVEPKFHEGDIVQYITDSTDRRKIEEIDTLCNMYHTDSSPIMFEIEDEWKVVVNAEDVEQESVDNVEPKFHEGNWVVWDNKISCHVDKVYQGEESLMYTITDVNNMIRSYDVKSFDNNARLWTIADANDGDVLVASDGSIFLFWGVDDCACKYYVALTTDNYVKINKEAKGGYWETSRAVYPATKEQRDTLIKAMANAGYTFDFEKKELRKIESKTLDPDKVIMWIRKYWPFKCWGNVTLLADDAIEKFKKNFGL